MARWRRCCPGPPGRRLENPQRLRRRRTRTVKQVYRSVHRDQQAAQATGAIKIAVQGLELHVLRRHAKIRGNPWCGNSAAPGGRFRGNFSHRIGALPGARRGV